ncbi:UDP-2,4-diacetamido-2,4,6-trideoxy-beta-L-altropyranose hydrolase [bacterium]|nr:UDP-2,4-diacetamido-2,4,6-trideoxy-beta-L-altropyranose hydrolase [FCB group bacterium]MBL7190094.1 UDP-2,4-diacetamido-2,4,6-trideoxy-beta-L-altropyranose hydrolase [bacterium]
MRILIRADADSRIGSGHIMRCLALAEAALKRGGYAHLLTGADSQIPEDRFGREGIEVHRIESELGSADDAYETVEFSRWRNVDWIVIDGYHFNSAYRKEVKLAGKKVLAIDDDNCNKKYHADIILNQNPHANETLYRPDNPAASLLLGSEYILLRNEFIKWLGWTRYNPSKAENLLITMGGADIENAALIALKGVKPLINNGFKAQIVVGRSNIHYDELAEFIKREMKGIDIYRGIKDMSMLMTNADIAVTAAGITLYEAAFLGLPCAAMVLSDNQYPIADSMSRLGAAVNLGWYNTIEPEEIGWMMSRLSADEFKRRRMCASGREIVDGLGRERALARMADFMRR